MPTRKQTLLFAVGEYAPRKSYHFVKSASLTDPSQACPVKSLYDQMVNGIIPDVKQNKVAFNNMKVEDLTSVDKRDSDIFDVHAEFRKNESAIKSGIDIINNKQKSKENEKKDS